MNEAELVKQVEGKPAPLPLLALQAFANTLDVEDDVDLLETKASLEDWLKRTELVEPGFKLRSEHLRPARQLRDALRDSLTANSEDRKDVDATRRLIEGARTLEISLKPDEDGHLSLDLSPVDTFAHLGSQLLAIAYQSQIEGTWERLKLCENPDCAWAFYDNSRNRSGSWCRMGQCGNRLKNRAYRERHKHD